MSKKQVTHWDANDPRLKAIEKRMAQHTKHGTVKVVSVVEEFETGETKNFCDLRPKFEP